MLRRLSFVAALAAGCAANPPAPVAPAPTPAPAPATARPTSTAAPTSPNADALAPPQPTLRLPKNFRPTRYAARLAIDPALTTFTGEIAIRGRIEVKSVVIWLHGKGLHVSKVVATDDNGQVVAGTATPRGEDLLELRFERPLEHIDWTITLTYDGAFDPIATAGAFRQVVDNRPYIFTQLEAVYARRVFPCIDEPDTKVPWQLTLDVPSSQVAVANMPVDHRDHLDPTHERITFATTPPLPSYLVAFAVGPFDIVDAGKTSAGVPTRIVTMHGRAADAGYAASTLAKTLDLEAAYYGIPYPYPKLDIVTIPITVGFGAMENPGAITFVESLMLFPHDKPSRAQQHEWVSVSAHEIAHQWFGDLVTTAWWDDIWLNEGFANWMENKILVLFDPSWHDERAELDMRDKALGNDTLASSRKIRQEIATPGDINNVFDSITYDKGASTLNMFESYVGSDPFRAGVRAYLNAHAFTNATAKDFVDAIGAAAHRDLHAAFDSFLDQPGAPEITATLACDHGAKLQLAQQRYVPADAVPVAAETWTVPVCVAYDRDGKRAEACTMLDGATGELALPTSGNACPRWVWPNANARGYYHVALTAPTVTALRDEAWPQLDWTERRAIVNEVNTAAKQAKLPLALALSFVPRMLAGGDRFAVGAAEALPESLYTSVPDELYGKYEAWLRAQFGAAAAHAGLVPGANDSLDAESIRSSLMWLVGWNGRDPKLTAEAVKLSAHWRDLPPAAREYVLTLACDADAAIFEQTRREVLTEPNIHLRQQMYVALADARDPQRHLQALSLLLEPKVDPREAGFMLFVNSTRTNMAASKQFFRDHPDVILARYPHDDTTGEALGFAGVFTQQCDDGERDQDVASIHQLFDKYPGAERAIAQTIEGFDQCIAHRKALAPELRGWLTGVKAAKPTAAPAKPAK